MRLIDRYLLRAFVTNYLISFFVLVGMYVVLDMVFNFDEFVAVKAAGGEEGSMSVLMLVRDIAEFYAFQAVLFFVQLSGIIPVVAAAFTLIRITRSNELVALLAAGVPLLRIVMPIILAGIVLSFSVLATQEAVIPQIIGQLTRKHGDVAGPEQNARTFPIRAMRDTQGNMLIASEFVPAIGDQPARMNLVDVIFFHNGDPAGHMKADSAEWSPRDGGWVLSNGVMVQGLLPDQERRPPRRVTIYPTTTGPDEIALYRSREFVDLLSTRRINQLLAQPNTYGVDELLRVKHFRFTTVLINIVLLLLAIPFLVSREPGQTARNMTKCLMVVGACLGTVFASQYFAGKPLNDSALTAHWPALMAWMPVLLFGPIAYYLLERMGARS